MDELERLLRLNWRLSYLVLSWLNLSGCHSQVVEAKVKTFQLSVVVAEFERTPWPN